MSEAPPSGGRDGGTTYRPVRRLGPRPGSVEVTGAGSGAAGPAGSTGPTGAAAADRVSIRTAPQLESAAAGAAGPGFVVQAPRAEDVSRRSERRAERQVGLLFLLSTAGTVLFLLAYVFGKIHTSDYGARMNVLLTVGLTLSMGGIGAGLIVWAKKLMPHESAVQQREPFATPEEERRKTEDTFFGGAEATGIGRRSLIRRSLALALGVLPLAAIFPLRDLGPAPGKTLRRTAWKKGTRLVEFPTGRPLKLGDLRVGGLLTVMPEHYEQLGVEATATSATLLIRLRPEEIAAIPGSANWSADGHVAFSAICTHAGCPVKLYEQQTHHLFCPCHQSTFDVLHHGRVLFGPAARSLPQLAIQTDPDGYFIAKGDYTQPVGPSFWERG